MKKKTKTRLLPMAALRSRPCEVDGRPALFHRWVEDFMDLVQLNAHTSPEDQVRLVDRLRDRRVYQTLALVEYRDGTIDKVDPLLVRFVDVEA